MRVTLHNIATYAYPDHCLLLPNDGGCEANYDLWGFGAAAKLEFNKFHSHSLSFTFETPVYHGEMNGAFFFFWWRRMENVDGKTTSELRAEDFQMYVYTQIQTPQCWLQHIYGAPRDHIDRWCSLPSCDLEEEEAWRPLSFGALKTALHSTSHHHPSWSPAARKHFCNGKGALAAWESKPPGSLPKEHDIEHPS